MAPHLPVGRPHSRLRGAGLPHRQGSRASTGRRLARSMSACSKLATIAIACTGLPFGPESLARRGAHLAFLDESGFLLIPNVRKTWAPVGHTPQLRHSYRHDRVSVISALTVAPQRR